MQTKQKLLILLFSMLLSGAMAQNKVVAVWPDGAPDHNGMNRPEEQFEGGRVRNVSEAEIFVFLPDKNSNTEAAVVICPGGGYSIEAMEHEGYSIAKWLQSKGIAGIVLKYRLPYGHDEIPSEDARRAMRMVRKMAPEWGIDPNKIGIAGSSAGGHLASTVGTMFDRGKVNAEDSIEVVSCRPDFMLLLYPVISMGDAYTHQGSRQNLMGKQRQEKLIQKYSNEKNVKDDTPPAFMVLADDDKSVLPQNSVEFYLQLKKYDIPAEMHIFRKGGHGFGIRKTGLPVDAWPDLFYDWLKAIHILQ